MRMFHSCTEWRPGMDQAPPMDQSAMPPEFAGDKPPPMASGDPAYPPMQGYEGVSFGQFSKQLCYYSYIKTFSNWWLFLLAHLM